MIKTLLGVCPNIMSTVEYIIGSAFDFTNVNMNVESHIIEEVEQPIIIITSTISSVIHSSVKEKLK